MTVTFHLQVSGRHLVISSVVLEDAGAYECTAHNPAGHTSARFLLTVHCKSYHIFNLYMNANFQTYSAKCLVNVNLQEVSIHIYPVICYEGNTEMKWLCFSAAPPSVMEEKNESVSLKRGEELKLSCTVLGHPRPRISWLKDGRVLINNQRVFLEPNGDLVVSRTKVCLTSLAIRSWLRAAVNL